MRRRIRLTPFGYLVVAVLILLLLGGIYLIIRGIGSGSSPAPTPTPPLAPAASVSPDPSVSTSPGLSPEPTPSMEPSSTPEMTPVPTNSPTPSPTDTPKPAASRTPSPDEVKNARDGKLTTGGVVLRAAPNTDGEILGKYVGGTNLKVYAESGDYYLVQVVKEEKYGYMAKKFVQVDTSTPEPITTSVPTGAIGGTVRSSVVALRSSPDLSDSSNKVGQVEQNEPVYIYFKYTNAAGDTFYYIEVARTGKKAYAFSEYITAESSVPTGTPVP